LKNPFVGISKQAPRKNLITLLVVAILILVSGSLANRVFWAEYNAFARWNPFQSGDAFVHQVQNMILIFLSTVGSLLGYFSGGVLADKYGRKRIFGFSFVIFWALLALGFAASNFLLLTLDLFVMSFHYGILFVSFFALLIDSVKPRLLAPAFGVFIGSANLVNLALWTNSDLEVSTFGFLVAAFVLSIVAFLIFRGILKASSNDKAEIPKGIQKFEPANLIRTVIFLLFTFALSYAILDYVLRCGEHFTSLSSGLGVQLIEITNVSAGVSSIVGGTIAYRVQRKRMMLFGYLTIPLMIALYFMDSSAHFFWVYVTIYSIYSASIPSYLSVLMEGTPSNRCASILGLSFYLQTFAHGAIYLTLGFGYLKASDVFLIFPILLLCLASVLTFRIRFAQRTMMPVFAETIQSSPSVLRDFALPDIPAKTEIAETGNRKDLQSNTRTKLAIEKGTMENREKHHGKGKCGNCGLYLTPDCSRDYDEDQELWREQKACESFEPKE